MLIFPEHYFEDEYREDFLVDKTMKTCWAAALEVLSDVERVCKKYGLQYYADYGTLLGAVRHKGFIPWDDDIDISLKRPDFNKLMEVLPKELPAGYQVHSPIAEKGCIDYFACIVNADTISNAPERLRRYHGCPFMVGIDIYPLDYIPRDPQKQKDYREVFELIRESIMLEMTEDLHEEGKQVLREALQYLESVTGYVFVEDYPMVNQLWKLMNLLATGFEESESDYLTLCSRWTIDESFVYRKEWFDGVRELPFENVSMPVAAGFDGVLTVEYGDYHTPVREVSSHDYPFYKKQMAIVRETLQQMEEEDKMRSRKAEN